MDQDAQVLMSYMSAISRKAYSARWIDHLEYVLWYAIVNGPMSYGGHEITQHEIDKLRELSRNCGGWIYFDEAIGETWTTLPDWQDRFTRNFEIVKLQ